MSPRAFELPFTPLPTLDPDLAVLGFVWVGDILSLRKHSVAYIVSNMLEQHDETGAPVKDEADEVVKVQFWKAQDHHGLKISGFVPTREDAVRAAEAWIINRNDLLVELVRENARLRQQ